MGKKVFRIIVWTVFLSLAPLIVGGATLKSAAARGNQPIMGKWQWFNGAIVNFSQNGICEATNGFVGSWQMLSSGEYEILWRLPGKGVR